MDFDSPAAAQKAVTALKSSGVQAQMAKVRRSPLLVISVIQSPLLLPPNSPVITRLNSPSSAYELVFSGPPLKCIDLERATC